MAVTLWLAGAVMAHASAPADQVRSMEQASATNALAPRTLVVGSEQDYPPFATGITDTTAGGFTVDLWTVVAQAAGLNYTLRVLPFHQLLKEFREGHIDVLINLAISDERRQFADFSIPHVTVHGAIFVRDDQTNIRSEADLAGKSILVLNADLAQDYAVANGWGPQLVTVDTAAEGLRLLAAGRHDAMLLSQLTGLQTLHTLALKNIKPLPIKAGFAQKFAFATHRGQVDLLAKINEELAVTKASGGYDTLYEKWFGNYEVKELGLQDWLKYISPVIILLLAWVGYLAYRRQVERNLAAAAIAESRDLLLAIIDAVPVRVFWKDRDLRYLGCNAAFAHDAGMPTPGEVIGKDDFHMGWAEQAELYRADDHLVMESGTARLSYDEPQTAPSGKNIWLRTSKVPLKNGRNEVVGVLGLYEDITERKQAEDNLKESEDFKNVILNSIDAEIAVLDHEGGILAVNDPWRRFALDNGNEPGKPDPSIEIGANYLSVCEAVTGPESSEVKLIIAGIQSVLRRQSPRYSLEYPCHAPTQMRWFSMVVSPIGRGVDAGVVITHMNITDRILAEQEKALALSRLQKLASRVPGLLYQYRLRPDGSSCFPYASEAIREIYQVSPDEVLEDASRVFTKLHPDDLGIVVSSIQISARELSPWKQEYRVKADDGTVRWVLGNAVPERETDGSTLWHGFISDITDRIRSAEKIATLMREQKAILNNELLGIITVRDRKIIWANTGLEKMLGYAPGELIGASTRQIYLNDDDYLAFGAVAYPVIDRGEVYRTRSEYVRKDGLGIWVDVSGEILNRATGDSLWVFNDITQRMMAESRLIQSEAKIKGILEGAADAIFIADKEGKLQYANSQAVNMLGYRFDELMGLSIHDVILKADWPQTSIYFGLLISTGSLRGEFRLRCKTGEVIPVDFNGSVLPDGSVFGSCRDISERKKTERLLHESESRLKTIIENEPECIKVVNAQGLLIQMNPAGLKMIEASSFAQVKDIPVLNIIAPEFRQAYADMHQRVLAGESLLMEFEVIGLTGRRHWLETHAVPMQMQGETVQLAVTRDISTRKLMEAQVHQLAFHDALTNLPNRRLLHDRLSQVLLASKRSGCYAALMFLDLDNFKPLNDAHGHEAGDLLLIEVARRLTDCVRESDTIARYGGDEFVVMLSELAFDQATSVSQALGVAEKIRNTLSKVYQLNTSEDGHAVVEHHCTASIGLVVFVSHDISQDEILKRADQAMYSAKDAGRNSVFLFEVDSGQPKPVMERTDH
ncbi:PAS domain S-box protein [Rhodoferax sp.]|uniref:PAS domain S-box protein n=1 Tax=Rhodoferax sp. TaxID=50421 RepID=UPI002615A8AD|nr:PAS domain S-box protein [Rhodoferax sp.]MDD2918226.1 PAS domain S-box protein [Rhodoferax sp.]